MKSLDENELREFLLNYEVCEPSSELVTMTNHLMHNEMMYLTARSLNVEKCVLLLVGLAVMLSLGLFYIVTIDTFLFFILPSSMLDFLQHLLYAFTAAGGSLIAGVIMMFYFKHFHSQQVYMS